MPNFAVIIPAAGRSTRFGGSEKKPFVSLDGRPIWQRSAELFWTREEVSKVYIVVAPEDREMFRSRYGHVLAFVSAELVDGGAERFESVANALHRIPADVEFVAIHDAVRPLTPPALIEAVFAAAAQHGAAILAQPVVDTLKKVDAEQHISATVPRTNLWAAQTPQVFRREWLVEAYAKRNEIVGAITDDAQLVEALGKKVRVVPGSTLNMKVTTRDDLELAELIVKHKKSKPAPAARLFDDEAKW